MKIIIPLSFLFLFFSCHSDGIDDTEEQNSVTFSFVKIEYIFDDNTFVKDIVKEQYSIVINNLTSINQNYIYEPDKYIFETSEFWSSDTRAFLFVNSDKKIITPLTGMEDGKVTYDDGTRWCYSENIQKEKPSIGESHPFVIEPNYRLSITPFFKIREIATTYNLYLKGNELGEEIVITGQWSGVIFLDYELKVIYEIIQ